MKQATTIEEQIERLQQRGIDIENVEKAKENLLDIGYFRLGFYLFPFEKTYPATDKKREHSYIVGTKFSSAITLYYFDVDLRNLLIRYISRIEVAFRTYLIYHISNKYKESPTWFVNPQIINSDFVNSFDTQVYTDKFKKELVIKNHHRNYINDRYAPAWKTIEFMPFGSVVMLYQSLKSNDDKKTISNCFGISNPSIFENYIDVVRVVRNKCAHGAVLFDMKIPKRITYVKDITSSMDLNKITAALDVIIYFVGKISMNRKLDLVTELNDIATKVIEKSPDLEKFVMFAKKND